MLLAPVWAARVILENGLDTVEQLAVAHRRNKLHVTPDKVYSVNLGSAGGWRGTVREDRVADLERGMGPGCQGQERPRHSVPFEPKPSGP